MKGVVFTEFLDLVEEKFSLATVDQIVTESAVASGGAYTAVGTYPAAEMWALVRALHGATGVPVPTLMETFGAHLFGRLAAGYPAFVNAVSDPFALLTSVEGFIHVEVRKLYPDAELPTLDARSVGPRAMELTYRSPRGLADLAVGLIRGCFSHYGVPFEMTREDLDGAQGTAVRFSLRRLDA